MKRRSQKRQIPVKSMNLDGVQLTAMCGPTWPIGKLAACIKDGFAIESVERNDAAGTAQPASAACT